MKHIIQEPFNSTLMSSIKAAYKYYYSKDIKDSLLFGLSGHAFVIQFTNGLGPCAPYTWDMKEFNGLVNDNIGLDMFLNQELITNETDDDFKENATLIIKNLLDEGNLVMLSSLEYQLIIGYNDTHFITTKPWDAPSVTPDLEFNTFKEIKEFLTYFMVGKTDTIDMKDGVINSIKYAISLYEDPPSTLDSAMGIKAFDYFLDKITDENAIGHGLWWSSVVWSESRRMASLYMDDLKEYFDQTLLDQLSNKYLVSSDILMKLSSKESNKTSKINLMKELKTNELQIYELLKKLI